ncbi:MAG: c-type cytochrome [Alphaproteobacteria bacterium]|nr:c-type cytochrome [Alphaproteobacteria bacterium]
MKNSVLILLIVLILFGACQSSQNNNTNNGNDITTNPAYATGVKLIANSDCLTCHSVEKAITGPSYKDIANKYENNADNISMLANKIIKGGRGNWGQIPMTPHPQMSTQDAEAIVQYIFLLKK